MARSSRFATRDRCGSSIPRMTSPISRTSRRRQSGSGRSKSCGSNSGPMAVGRSVMDGTLMMPRARSASGVSIRPRLLRYAGLVVALLAFLIGVFFSFQGLFEQRELIEKESRIDMWFLAQVEIEFLQLMESMTEFARSPNTH